MIKKEIKTACSKVINDIARLTREKYVYPEMGEQIAAHLEANFKAGKYDRVVDEIGLAQMLTMDLRVISEDQHWYVAYDPKCAAEEVDPEHDADKGQLGGYVEMRRKDNFGFEKVEHLKGNIGYIDLHSFDPSEYAGETAASAMKFVSNCDALIFDLRKNHGGFPSMVQLIISYLTDVKPVLINTFYFRPTNDTQQFWTFPYVPGKRMPNTPIYLLTSKDTGSAGEEFVYDLKYMKRATLIGETTLGSAHPVHREIVQKVFSVHLPYGRPINPITGTNWEGTGVEPHISVPASEALTTAHIQALENLSETCKDTMGAAALQWELDMAKSEYFPLALDEPEIRKFAGVFDIRKFEVKDGHLIYAVEGINVSWQLIPMSRNTFRLDEDVKFDFALDASGQAKSVTVNYKDGRPSITANRSR